MKRVIVFSPLKGDYEKNQAYARECVLDCLKRGEAPFASHVIYPLVLDDTKAEERKLGMDAGRAWFEVCEYIVVYTDLGISDGMAGDIKRCEKLGIKIVYRKLYDD